MLFQPALIKEDGNVGRIIFFSSAFVLHYILYICASFIYKTLTETSNLLGIKIKITPIINNSKKSEQMAWVNLNS